MSRALDLLVLRLTNRCNLSCRYCYASGGTAGEDLPPDLALRAVDLACAPGEELRVQFTGGEPLLRWDTMVRVMEHGARTGRRLRASLQTNGVLLTPELCRDLKRFSIGVGVSLDGVSGAENATRSYSDGSASFPEVLRGLQTLAEAGIGTNLMTVVTRYNAVRLDALLDFSLWLGNVHGLGLDLVRGQGRGAERNLSPTPEALDEGLSRLFARHDLLERLGRPIRIKELERLRLLLRTGRRRSCYCNAQTDRSLAVGPDGSLWPCSALLGTEGFRLGKLCLEEPSSLSRAVPTGLEVPQTCLACGLLGFCGGGCPAGRLGKTEPSPLDCRMHRLFYDHALTLEGQKNRQQ